MNKQRSKVGSIYGELDAAFGTVQAERLRHESGCEDAQSVARECVLATAASIRRQLLQAPPLSPAETGLIEAKLKALIGAAARIPGPGSVAAEERQPQKAAAPLGR